jgi:hypothetical protein
MFRIKIFFRFFSFFLGNDIRIRIIKMMMMIIIIIIIIIIITAALLLLLPPFNYVIVNLTTLSEELFSFPQAAASEFLLYFLLPSL